MPAKKASHDDGPRPVGTIAAAIARGNAETGPMFETRILRKPGDNERVLELKEQMSIYESDKPGSWHVGCGACGWHSYGLDAREHARLQEWGQLHARRCPAL